jgi:nucleoside phosphorylase/CheY-like chemotaxis protein
VKILLIDDQPTKAKQVVEEIREELADLELHFDIASTVAQGKQFLRKAQYDLLILDIALPLRDGDKVRREGGIDLLRSILGRAGYHLPKHIVGLTAYDDVFTSASDAFGSELWSLVRFDTSSNEWLTRISNKIRHIASSNQEAVVALKNRTNICVVVALQDELDAVLANGWDWKELAVAGDGTVYHGASYETSAERRSAVVGKSSNMGMPAACVLATKMIMTFHPHTLAMTGICAGDGDQVALGDVVVGNPVWDYGSGKHVEVDGTSRLIPAPYQLGLSSRVRGAVERLCLDSDFCHRIHKQFVGAKPRAAGKIHVGPMASGSAVVANAQVFENVQKSQHRKLLGIDMEAYGVMCAANDAPSPQPDTVVIKGVSDFADRAKSDSHRIYASYSSAAVLTALCERYEVGE